MDVSRILHTDQHARAPDGQFISSSSVGLTYFKTEQSVEIKQPLVSTGRLMDRENTLCAYSMELCVATARAHVPSGSRHGTIRAVHTSAIKSIHLYHLKNVPPTSSSCYFPGSLLQLLCDTDCDRGDALSFLMNLNRKCTFLKVD